MECSAHDGNADIFLPLLNRKYTTYVLVQPPF
jgi:hypothetical protein